MRKLTVKWLIENNACDLGVKWFRRNYPDGMIYTKRNVRELVERLYRRKKDFRGNIIGKYFNIFEDTRMNIKFLLDQIGCEKECSYETNAMYKLRTETDKNLADAFWKDYKEIIKSINTARMK